MMTITEWSDATAMAEAVQNQMVSPRELVEATIREAERTNPIDRCYRQSTLRESY